MGNLFQQGPSPGQKKSEMYQALFELPPEQRTFQRAMEEALRLGSEDPVARASEFIKIEKADRDRITKLLPEAPTGTVPVTAQILDLLSQANLPTTGLSEPAPLSTPLGRNAETGMPLSLPDLANLVPQIGEAIAQNRLPGPVVRSQPELSLFGGPALESLPQQPAPGAFVPAPVVTEAARRAGVEPDPIKLPISPVSPKDYTSESIAAWGKTVTRDNPSGNVSLLQVREEKKPLGGTSKFDAEQSLRKEFTAQSKVFIDVRDSFARIEASSQNPSAAGDLSLIFNYMKMLDPASVVRESEFAQAAATGAWGDRIAAAAAKILEGKRLSNEMRSDFVDRSKKLMQRQNAQHELRKAFFGQQAEEFGLDGKNIIAPFEDPLVGATIIGKTKEGKDVWQLKDGSKVVVE